MFEGGGFGVGLTVHQLDDAVPGQAELPPGVESHPTRLGELMPVTARTDAELAEEMRRANLVDSRLWAYRVEMIAQLAARRRDDRDRAPGSREPRRPSGRRRVPRSTGSPSSSPTSCR